MKKLLPLLLIAACGNPKEKIIEQQKAFKDSIQASAGRQIELENERGKLITRYEQSDTVAFYQQTLKAITHEEVNQFIYNKKIDSLEMELKKY